MNASAHTHRRHSSSAVTLDKCEAPKRFECKAFSRKSQSTFCRPWICEAVQNWIPATRDSHSHTTLIENGSIIIDRVRRSVVTQAMELFFSTIFDPAIKLNGWRVRNPNYSAIALFLRATKLKCHPFFSIVMMMRHGESSSGDRKFRTKISTKLSAQSRSWQ